MMKGFSKWMLLYTQERSTRFQGHPEANFRQLAETEVEIVSQFFCKFGPLPEVAAQFYRKKGAQTKLIIGQIRSRKSTLDRMVKRYGATVPEMEFSL